MKRKIRNIIIIGKVIDKSDSNHDVNVEFENGEKFVATFFTIPSIQKLMGYYKKNTGECSGGDYFWSSNMCIIEEIEEGLLLKVIGSMIEEEIFDNIFQKITV